MEIGCENVDRLLALSLGTREKLASFTSPVFQGAHGTLTVKFNPRFDPKIL